MHTVYIYIYIYIYTCIHVGVYIYIYIYIVSYDVTHVISCNATYNMWKHAWSCSI